jgi:hypothetical protein
MVEGFSEMPVLRIYSSTSGNRDRRIVALVKTVVLLPADAADFVVDRPSRSDLGKTAARVRAYLRWL